MLNHSRWITVGVASGLLALMGASLLRAQQQPEPRRDTLQTGAVTPADTALRAKPGLQTGPARGDTLRPVHRDSAPPPGSVNKQSGEFQYHGAATDTALRAKPGTQTGRTAADSGKGHGRAWKKKGTAADSTRAKRDSTQ